MNRIFLLILVSIFTVSTASAQTTFLKKLKKGEKQTVVFYGSTTARSRESALSGQRKTSRTPY